MGKQFFNSNEYELENGIQLITIKKETHIASIHIGMKIGAMYENMDEKGMSHFIEHMLFKGTGKRDNHRINQDFEERAGSYDAYTDYTATVFSITALAEELETSTDLLSDMMMNATFPEEEIEKERKVILAEFKSDMDDVEQYSFLKINEIAFKKSPLRYDILGRKKTINGFTRDQLKRFYKKHYIPNKCVISIVSPFDHNLVKEMIEKYFKKWEKGKEETILIRIEKNKNVERISYKNNIEQNTILFLYTFHELTHKEELALQVLNHKLGQSANSILFRALREEKGFSYDAYAEIDTTPFIKTLYIYTTAEENEIREAKKVIEACIEKIKAQEIYFDDKNIIHMKKVVKTAVVLMLEDVEGLGNYVLHQKMMDKKINAFIDDMEELDNIQSDDIYKVANRVFCEPTIHILLSKNE
ncbi:M16 family metallopeptidase [Marinisporobacter balticus]|uniref:Putative Zn-dependent peptidase n=1 Tax=Marinisporobacter balticus TaxID=2018667 RepID=A0A4R2KZ94_9FIRM|nr:pitrilysin family protein [Marinisporobacter balticus]TCO79434.1 putative Zn-dependent peptidase [Marinisporobacter balticus]